MLTSAERAGSRHHGHGIDPNLNRHLVEGITRVIEAEVPIYIASLSRLSRNMDRLLCHPSQIPLYRLENPNIRLLLPLRQLLP